MSSAAASKYSPSSSLLSVPAVEDLTEYTDTPEELAAKVSLLADLVRSAAHAVAFTGAGISHSSGIPTYRGPDGVWTRRDQGLPAPQGVRLEDARPTQGHMAILELLNQGHLKHLVSTNVDGLHRRSGVTKDQMSELHGNIYMEACTVCDKEYHRRQRVRGRAHLTGNQCDACKGPLKDNIINFNENLPEGELTKSFEHSARMDLALVMGTSMKVTPACELPLEVLGKEGGHLVIVNLQRTGYDEHAFLRIFGESDRVLTMLLDELRLTIPEFDEEA